MEIGLASVYCFYLLSQRTIGTETQREVNMSYGYQALQFSSLKRETKLYQPISMRSSSIDFDEPAIMAMTDFKHITPFSVELLLELPCLLFV